MFKKLMNQLGRLHKSEQGAEGLEKILIIGAIILPLLGILIFFKTEITTWMQNIWGDVKNDNTDYKYDGNF